MRTLNIALPNRDADWLQKKDARIEELKERIEELKERKG